ncbi:hypothetical protein [Streptomyces scabiei]|uniref:hypothetical protein n=1 Tax=Streptomyces scabiei TaxID=1930 RepID=UPI0029BC8ED8|nr:hypothetical protein [Streptomyces scabiei]MDX2804955.1 hypothetical protein [Streptomyces scabiei]
MQGPQRTRSALALRLSALLALTWLLAGAPSGPAAADACAYADIGPGGGGAGARRGPSAEPGKGAHARQPAGERKPGLGGA